MHRIKNVHVAIEMLLILMLVSIPTLNYSDKCISSPWKVLNCHFVKWQFSTFQLQGDDLLYHYVWLTKGDDSEWRRFNLDMQQDPQ